MQKGQTLIFLLVGMLIIAGGAFYLGRQTTPKTSPNPVVTSQTPLPTENSSPTSISVNETANWKTYNSYEDNFVMKYPPNWTEKDRSAEVGTATIRFEGPEGFIDISFGKGFGGVCNLQDNIQIQIFGTQYNACHHINTDGTENFNGIFKQISAATTFAVGATVNNPAATNRQTILKVFSTFKFTN